MKRFTLSPFATYDLEDLITYLGRLPPRPATRLGEAVRQTLERIGENPFHGTAQSELTRMMGFEVRSRLVASYRILYRVGPSVPEILAIVHSARDMRSIMAKRVQ